MRRYREYGLLLWCASLLGCVNPATGHDDAPRTGLGEPLALDVRENSASFNVSGIPAGGPEVGLRAHPPGGKWSEARALAHLGALRARLFPGNPGSLKFDVAAKASNEDMHREVRFSLGSANGSTFVLPLQGGPLNVVPHQVDSYTSVPPPAPGDKWYVTIPSVAVWTLGSCPRVASIEPSPDEKYESVKEWLLNISEPLPSLLDQTFPGVAYYYASRTDESYSTLPVLAKVISVTNKALRVSLPEGVPFGTSHVVITLPAGLLAGNFYRNMSCAKEPASIFLKARWAWGDKKPVLTDEAEQLLVVSERAEHAEVQAKAAGD